MVFVTGQSDGDYATVAYSAVTGKQLWARRYNGPGNDVDAASAVAVGPGGSTVFVTGNSAGRGVPGYAEDYATVAYSAATGRQLWVSRYTGPPSKHRDNVASSLAVSPGGSRVFVTGYSQDGTSSYDYATVAYGAGTGKRLWVRRYNGPANKFDVASSVAVSPGGRRVFVTGESDAGSRGGDYATVAYSAVTGKQLWVRRYNGPRNRFDDAFSVAVSPAGTTVYVTGANWGGRATELVYAALAYSG
jgi:WD40 repeat protein